jgi:glycerophosphoryl diester phosphodiesterase
VKCIGHGGASALAPANSLASFRLAAELGADAVEFDLRAWRGRLTVAHTALGGWRGGSVGLEDALRWFATEGGAGLELVVDLKTGGTQAPVLASLRRHELLDRATLTSQRRPILDAARRIDGDARLAISVAGRASRLVQRWGSWRDEIVGDLRARRYDAVMAHRQLVDGDLVDRVHAAGAELHVWTVRNPADVEPLRAAGVDGIVTTDPRLVAAGRPART